MATEDEPAVDVFVITDLPPDEPVKEKEDKREKEAVDPQDVIPDDFDKEQEIAENINPGLPERIEIAPPQLDVPSIADIEIEQKKKKMLGRKK